MQLVVQNHIYYLRYLTVFIKSTINVVDWYKLQKLITVYVLFFYKGSINKDLCNSRTCTENNLVVLVVSKIIEISRSKVVDFIYFYFNLFFIFLFLELKVRDKVMTPLGHTSVTSDNIVIVIVTSYGTYRRK